MKAVRIPREPWIASYRGTGFGLRRRMLESIGLWPWLTLMRVRLRAAGMRTNDYVFGRNDTAQMSAERIAGFLPVLPDGVGEIYSHPEIGNEEFLGLIDPRVKETLAKLQIAQTAFSDL